MSLKSATKRAGAAAIVLLTAAHASAQLEISVDVPIAVENTVIAPADVVASEANAGASIPQVDDGVNLVAFHQVGPKIVLASWDVDVEVGGVLFRPRDVARVEGNTASKVIDGDELDLPPGSSIDALTVDVSGHILFSLDVDFTVDGELFTRADLLRVGDEAIEVVFDASANGIDAGLDLDAAHDTGGGGELILSFDGHGTVGALTFDGGDLLRWSPSSGFALMERPLSIEVPADANVDAVSQFTPPTPTPTNTVGAASTPTNTPVVGSCFADCDASGAVTVDELIVGVNIALGLREIDDCPPFDSDGNGTVSVDEVIRAIDVVLQGCPSQR